MRPEKTIATPEEEPAADELRWVNPVQHARAIDIIRRVRRRLVNQRRSLNELTRAYVAELEFGFRREQTIADLRNRVVELEQRLEKSRAKALGNFFQRWFGP